MNVKNMIVSSVSGNMENAIKMVETTIEGVASQIGPDGILATLGGLSRNGNELTMSFKPMMGDYAGYLERATQYESINSFPSLHTNGAAINGIGHMNGVDFVWGNQEMIDDLNMRKVLGMIRDRIISAIGPNKRKFYLPLVPSGNKNHNMVRCGTFEKDLSPVRVMGEDKIGDLGVATSMTMDIDNELVMLGVTQAKTGYVASITDVKKIKDKSIMAPVIGKFENMSITTLGLVVDGTMRIAFKTENGGTKTLGKFGLKNYYASLKEKDPVKAIEMRKLTELGALETFPDNFVFGGTAQSGHGAFLNTTKRTLVYFPAIPMEGGEVGHWFHVARR